MIHSEKIKEKSPSKKIIYRCSNCCNILNMKERVYRCGDAFVCCMDCANGRIKMIRKIDPTLKTPDIWPRQNEKYNTIFNSKIVTNINRSHLKIENKKYPSISNNLHFYNDLKYDSENSIDEEEPFINIDSDSTTFDSLDENVNNNSTRFCISIGTGFICLISVILFYN